MYGIDDWLEAAYEDRFQMEADAQPDEGTDYMDDYYEDEI